MNSNSKTAKRTGSDHHATAQISVAHHDGETRSIDAVSLPLALNFTGPEVGTLQEDLSKLGFSFPETERNPHLKQFTFGIATLTAVQQVQENSGLKPTGIVDAATRLALDSALSGEGGGHTIQGQIRFQNGRPAANLRIGLYRRGFGSEPAFVTETTTNSLGFYMLDDPNSAAERFDIRVMPPDQAGSEVRVEDTTAISPVRLRPLRNEIINLIAPVDLEEKAVEHTSLSTALASAIESDMGERAEDPLSLLGGAREKGNQRDITYLRQATGWDARLIALAATAQRLSDPKETGLPAAALYGLYRTGLPMDARQLARYSVDAIMDRLEKAQAAKIVTLSDKDLAAAREAFATFSSTQRMQARVPGALSSPEEMLAVSGLPGPRANRRPRIRRNDDAEPKTPQDIFRNLFLTHTGTVDDFWREVGQALPNDVSRLQAQSELARLTLNNAPLVASLMQTTTNRRRNVNRALAEIPIDRVEALPRLVDARLYRQQNWEDQITSLGGDAAIDNPDLYVGFIPPAYTGEPAERLAAYAGDLARQVRLTYPTRVAAFMLIPDGDAAPEITLGGHDGAAVSEFLLRAEERGFRLGQTRIDTFVEDEANAAAVFAGRAGPQERAAATAGVKTLQRMFQVTPSAESLQTVDRLGLTSAAKIAAIPRELFLASYAREFPSLEEATLVHRKAEQVAAVSRRVASEAQLLAIGPDLAVMSGTAHPLRALVNGKARLAPGGADRASTTTAARRKTAVERIVKTYPSLEYLFGELDYCACDHCHSVLSPAAYFVDLLKFLDPDLDQWKTVIQTWGQKVKSTAVEGDPEFLPYPFPTLEAWREHLERYPDAKPADYNRMPYDVLTTRRPDLPRLPLTCENALTALPYIDVVNEILEYYVTTTVSADPDAWSKLPARDTGNATTAELLAEPQNTLPDAYTVLKGAKYPLTLPFDLWLETSRRFCDHFRTPLWRALEIFRPSDELKVPLGAPEPGPNDPPSYGWADILREYLGLSPDAAGIFTQENPLDHWSTLYGYDDKMDAFSEFRFSAATLARRLGVSYEELAELVTTAFVNPAIADFVVLHELDVSAKQVVRYLREDSPMTPDERTAFEQQLQNITNTIGAEPPVLDWLKMRWQAGKFDRLLLLEAPDDGTCDFAATKLNFARKVDDALVYDAYGLVYLRMNLFVRLWRALGWTISEVDHALSVFVPADHRDLEACDLTAAFPTVLIYLAHLKRLQERTRLGKDGVHALLTLWSELPTVGTDSRYAQLFLARNAVGDAKYFDHPLNQFLQYYFESEDGAIKEFRPFSWDPNTPEWDPDPEQPNPNARGNVSLKSHLVTVQGALNLTADEIALILADTGSSVEAAALTLEHLSRLYRYRVLAKGLGLSIADLIAIKSLSGLNPFTPLEPGTLETLTADHPFQQTLAFVDVVERIKTSEFRVADLDYLFRHRFDPVGPYRPDDAALLALVKKLAAGLGQIAAETTIPADLSAFSDDLIRQHLSLLHPAAVADAFLAMWSGTLENSAEVGAPAVWPIDLTEFEDEPGLRLTYDAEHERLRLTYRGLLFPTDYDRLRETHTHGAFRWVLDDVYAQQQAQRELVFQHLGLYLVMEADLKVLLAPVPATATDLARQEAIAAKRKLLAEKLLPVVRQELNRRFVIETLAGELAADAPLLAALLTDKELLTDPSRAGATLLDAFADVTARGVSVTYFLSAHATGLPLVDAAPIVPTADTSLVLDGEAIRPAAARSVVFAGYLEAPEQGDYTFAVTGGEEGTVFDFRLHDRLEPVFIHTAGPDGADTSAVVELKAGAPYAFTLRVTHLGESNMALTVQGGTLPMGALSQLALYPAAPIERAARARTLLTKALQLIAGLALTEREIRHLARRRSDFGGFHLRRLPTHAEPAPGQLDLLFAWFLRLLDYSRLRDEMAGGSDEVTDVFELARRQRGLYPAGASDREIDEAIKNALAERIGELSRRQPPVVRETMDQLAIALVRSADGSEIAAPTLTNERGLRRLWDALQVVERFGIPAASLARWIDPAPNQTIATELRRTVKARYEAATWQRVAPSIFDPLRQRQRDALVAYVLHQLEDQGIERIEQLFEYFLIDPGMEPVVQTSRLRLALSSVQLFVQRCLLNLEPEVPATALQRASEWSWMNRYRVWEANRKIFLYPENWLEPEFRDDKSHLYQELEGKLLQGDVTDDLAEDAFLAYLRGLEELARLDIVTGCAEGSTLHVIGRTYSQPHKYFYRRYEDNEWTPWEPVTAEIEGDHVVAVIWRGRLYVFWATFMPKASNPQGMLASVPTAKLTAASSSATVNGTVNGQAVATSDSGNKPVTQSTTMQDLTAGQLKDAAAAVFARQEWEAALNWSDLFQGQWSTREASGAGTAAKFAAGPNFDPRKVYLHAAVETKPDGNDVVNVSFIGPSFSTALTIVGRNSAPQAATAATPNNTMPFYGVSNTSVGQRRGAAQYAGSGALTITYTKVDAADDTYDEKISETILNNTGQYTLLPLPGSRIEDAAEDRLLGDRFFYADDVFTFLVAPDAEATEGTKWVKKPGGAIIDPDDIPDVFVDPQQPPIPPWDWPVINPGDGVTDPPPMIGGDLTNPIYEGVAGHDWLVNENTGLQYDDHILVAGGALDATQVSIGEAAGQFTTGQITNVIAVAEGSAGGAGSVLVADGAGGVPVNALGGVVAGGLSIVGGNGVNATLAKSIATRAVGNPAARAGTGMLGNR